MNAIIYLEGGASGPDSKTLTIRCQQAFHQLLDSMGFKGRKPRLKACGGRASVFEDFCTAHRTNRSEYIAMWIDSEEPMTDIEAAWKHLAEVTTVAAWQRPKGAEDEQVLFMTTCMESWIVADVATLRAHYGKELNENSLPAPNDLEKRSRKDVQSRLETATKNCKNAYAKGKRSFEILEKLQPSTLRQQLPSFARIERILQEKL